MIVDAAGGKFIKWTGDGFIAWFEMPLHRMLGEKAATVFDAATQLSFIVNVTQLGLKPKRKFKIRHGVSYEQDALLIKISHEGGVESLDLIGRAVVLAFRLSGIPAKSPSIVTIYISIYKPRKAKSLKTILREAKEAINSVESESIELDRSSLFSERFLENIAAGPDWGHEVVDEYAGFVREGLLGSLKKLVHILEESTGKRPCSKEGAA